MQKPKQHTNRKKKHGRSGFIKDMVTGEKCPIAWIGHWSIGGKSGTKGVSISFKDVPKMLLVTDRVYHMKFKYTTKQYPPHIVNEMVKLWGVDYIEHRNPKNFNKYLKFRVVTPLEACELIETTEKCSNI